MPTIDIVKDEDGFKALKGDWNTLALESGLSIFQSWEWAWHWWQANKRGKKLWLLVAKDEGGIGGIAPLYISSSYLGLPVKVAALLGTNGSDYLNVLIKPGREDIAHALAEFLLGSTGWDVIDLHQLSSTAETAGMIADDTLQRMAPSDISCERIVQDPAFNLALPGNWDDYLSTLSKKFRWNVQYYSRRLAREHNLAFRVSDPATVADDMALFFKLHQKRFLAKKKPGAYINPKFRKFHTELATELCNAGRLRLYIMEIDGRPIAALYGFAFGTSFYYYLGGFEPEWGAMSVSTVLIAKAIEDAITTGLKNFDFLRGQEPYKLKWLAEESSNYRLIISRSGKKSGMVQKMLALENELTKRAKEKMQK